MAETLQIGKTIYGNGDWLDRELVQIANEALSAHELHKFTLAINKAGGFLEGVLADLLEAWGAPANERPTLGPLIGSIRKSLVEEDVSALLERLNEANNIRNRSAHKTEPLRQVTEGDSLQMLHIMALVVEWCGPRLRSESSEAVLCKRLPVFFSVGGAHRLEQEQFLEHLRASLFELEIDLRTLDAGDFSREKPFDQICKLARSCSAALVVGLDRNHAYTVFERERSSKEVLNHDRYTTTPWNQIESGIASALELPVLILREKTVHCEGVFEAENHRHRMRDFDLTVESQGLSYELLSFLEGWARALHTKMAAEDGEEGQWLPAPVDTSSVDLGESESQLSEQLAAESHHIWARLRIDEGWRRGPRRDDFRKEDPHLVPYDELPEAEKERNRKTSQQTLRSIVALGFRIMRH